jgi:hypothetical protein
MEQTMSDGTTSTLIPASKAAKRYDRTTRTIDRWLEREVLDFPKPIVVNGRRYWRVSDLEDWERRQAAAGCATTRPPKAQKASSEMEAA